MAMLNNQRVTWKTTTNPNKRVGALWSFWAVDGSSFTYPHIPAVEELCQTLLSLGKHNNSLTWSIEISESKSNNVYCPTLSLTESLLLVYQFLEWFLVLNAAEIWQIPAKSESHPNDQTLSYIAGIRGMLCGKELLSRFFPHVSSHVIIGIARNKTPR